MKAFTFRLQTLLKVRQSSRDKALRSYGLAVRQTDKLNEELTCKKKEIEDLQASIRQKRSSSFFAQEQEHLESTLSSLKDDIVALHGQLQNALKIQNSKRDLFLKADSQLKSFEMLREKQKQSHEFSELKKEEIQVNDIISSRFKYRLNSTAL